MKGFTRLVCIAMLCSSTLFSYAQQGDTLEIQRNQKGKVSFARFRPAVNRKMQDAIAFLKAVLQAKTEDEFQLLKDTIDGFGIAHRRYQQYYKGIKVEDAEYLVHGKNGVIETINGDFQEVNLPTVIPSITEQQALSKALVYVSAKKYKWEDPEMEKFIKQRINNSKASYYPKGELVITRNYLNGGNYSRLAWKFSISSLIPNNEQWIYTDSQTGEIIRKTPRIYDVNTPCTAETLYSGTVTITGDSFTGGYRLRENRNGVNVLTLNLQHTYDFANAIDFVNSNTNFTSSGWTSFSVDRPALDAHLGAESVLDYWRTVHG